MPKTTTIELAAAASPEANAALTAMLHALQGALRADPGDTSALEAGIADALIAYDRYLALVVEAHPMTCSVGCTACCHDNPRGVTGVEIARLAREIAGWPDADAVHARFVAYAAARTDAEAWRRARHPCPLLDAEGTCRAYNKRPLACRAFVAMTPAAWCDPTHDAYGERVNPHLDPPRVILQILQALSARAGLAVAVDLHTGMANA